MAQRASRGNGHVYVSVGSIARHFEALPDPRHHRNRRPLLADVVTIAVCEVIVGCPGPTAMEQWARSKRGWLKRWLKLPNGIPSRDCIRRVLSRSPYSINGRAAYRTGMTPFFWKSLSEKDYSGFISQLRGTPRGFLGRSNLHRGSRRPCV
ncbi:MAG: transposase family protein [Phycisphaerae bacterium]|nr:transposase family protein [Phycisphaerae bacterium]